MPSFLTIFARSSLYANLSPGERAILRFLGVLLSGAFLAGVQAVIPLLNSANPLDPSGVPWASVAHTFLAAFALAVWLGIGKYRSAQGDPPLPMPAPLPSISPPAAPSIPAAPPASTLVSAPPLTPPAAPVAPLADVAAPAAG